MIYYWFYEIFKFIIMWYLFGIYSGLKNFNTRFWGLETTLFLYEKGLWKKDENFLKKIEKSGWLWVFKVVL